MGNGLSGKALPYAAGQEIPTRWTSPSWRFYNATATGASASTAAFLPVATLWRCSKKSEDGRPRSEAEMAAVQNGVKRLKSLRHPFMLKVLEVVDSDTEVCVVTEPAQPLSQWQDEMRGSGGTDLAAYADACVWGLYCICTALSFLHHDCNVLHAALHADSVWVTKSGDWKLAGFDLATTLATADGTSFPDSAFLEGDRCGFCPEVAKSPERAAREWGALRGVSPVALDSYALGVLMLDVFAGPLRSSLSVKQALESNSTAIPASLRPWVTRLLSAAPRTRPTDYSASIGTLEYFRHPLVGALLFVDNLALKEPGDKQKFFKSLPSLLPRMPDAIAKYRLLPALMNALEFGAAGGGGTVVLAPILDIGARLTASEYAHDIVPCLLRLFANNDRATRVQLLHHLPTYIDKLSAEVVNTSIFPSIVNGFSDTTAALREATVKASLHISAKLTDANRYGVLCKHLKRMLDDPEPALRVNTLICLGRIADTIGEASQREETLLQSFMRALRDNFPHARAAALRAITHCVTLEDGVAVEKRKFPLGYFGADLVAKKLVPAAAFLTLDPFGDARDAAFHLLDICVSILRKHSSVLAVEEAKRLERERLADAASGAVNSLSGGGISTGAGSGGVAGKAADAFTGALGWAVSSLASRIIPSGTIEEGPPSTTGSTHTRSSSAAQTNPPITLRSPDTAVSTTTTSTSSAGSRSQGVRESSGVSSVSAHTSVPPSSCASASGARAMQLGGHSKASGSRTLAAAADVDGVASGDASSAGWGEDAWGDLDAVVSKSVKPSSKFTLSAGVEEPVGRTSGKPVGHSGSSGSTAARVGGRGATAASSTLKASETTGVDTDGSSGWAWGDDRPVAAATVTQAATSIHKLHTSGSGSSSKSGALPVATAPQVVAPTPAPVPAVILSHAAPSKASKSGKVASGDGWDEW